MKTSASSGYGVCVVAAAVTLASCGATQPPISAPAPAGAYRSLPASSSSYKVLYFFAGKPDGAYPQAPLIDVTGTLYGTTYDGGSSGDGTVFSISASGAEKVLYSFAGGSDGANPQAGLTNLNGTLYGTTNAGGSSGDGTVYSVSTSGVEKVLYSFAGSSDGAHPVAGLTNLNGTLYGTTLYGGSSDRGTVYSVSVSGAEKVLYSFAGGSDGANPFAGLIDVRGTLYGTTFDGGSTTCDSLTGCGTVYSITTTGKEKLLYRFGGGSDGESPQAGLLNVGGMLYGTTNYGGGTPCTPIKFPKGKGQGCGTVYHVSTTGSEKVVYRFGGRFDGAISAGGLVDVKGTLYGTTFAGGAGDCGYPNGCGTVYSVSTTGNEQVLHSFAKYFDGSRPLAGLTDLNGTLYGTSADGRKGHRGPGFGSVFTLSP